MDTLLDSGGTRMQLFCFHWKLLCLELFWELSSSDGIFGGWGSSLLQLEASCLHLGFFACNCVWELLHVLQSECFEFQLKPFLLGLCIYKCTFFTYNSDNVKHHLSRRHHSVLTFLFNLIFDGGCTCANKKLRYHDTGTYSRAATQ